MGCYKGASLVGAATSNPQARIFACDNFSQFDGAADALRRTLDAHTAPGQVTFHDMDFRAFLAAAPWAPARIGAYFYDGGHSFADQYDGVALAIPHLADDAVVIIDDTNKRAARSANNLVASAIPGFKLILDLRTPRNHSPTWWNGVQVFRYQRRPTDASIKFPTQGFSHPQTNLRRHLLGNEAPPPSPKKSPRNPLDIAASQPGAGVTPAEEV